MKKQNYYCVDVTNDNYDATMKLHHSFSDLNCDELVNFFALLKLISNGLELIEQLGLNGFELIDRISFKRFRTN